MNNQKEYYGLNKKSFSMFFGGGEIWFEHLDGIYDKTNLAVEKLENDYLEFKRPSLPSLIAFNIDETVVDDILISSISDKLMNGQKRFTRVAFIGAEKNVERKLKKTLFGAEFALKFTDDFEKAKEWLVGEKYK